MGLFKSKIEKANENISANLGLFDLSKLHLEDDEIVIFDKLSEIYKANVFDQIGASFRGNSTERTLVAMQQLLFQQNWLIIKYLDRIDSKLESLEE